MSPLALALYLKSYMIDSTHGKPILE